MRPLNSSIATLLLVLGLSAICTRAGVWLIWHAESRPTDPYWALGAGFFVGISCFLFCWRVLALTMGLKSALALSVLLIGIFAALSWRQKPELPRHSIRYCVTLFAFLSVLTIAYWTDFSFTNIHSDSNIGSLHSGRYSNLALFIAEKNRIPIIGQNFEQSLLASIGPIFSCVRPLLALALWLVTSQVALLFLCRGLLRDLGLSCSESLWGTGVVFLGQLSLSSSHLIIVDAGSPIGLSGYSDAVRSVGSFLIFSMLFLRSGSPRCNVGSLFVFVSLWFGWSVSAPQNILITLFVLAAGVARYFRDSRRWVTLLLGLLLTLATRPLGGMMASAVHRENIPVTGIRNTWTGPTRLGAFTFRPEIPYMGLKRYAPGLDSVWTALRVLFFAGLGLVGLGYLKTTREETHFWSLSILIFLGGAGIVFLFDINGLRWEWTRLMIPGYCFATVCLVVFCRLLCERIPVRFRTKCWMILLIVTTFGPLHSVISKWKTHLEEPRTFLVKLKTVWSHG